MSLGLVNFLRTVCFNFKYLPYNTAKHIPVFLTGQIDIKGLHKGALIIDNPHVGSVVFGPQPYSYAPKLPSYLHIEGIMRIKGSGFHSFHPGFIIVVYPNAYLEIGNNFSVAPNLKMSVTNKIVIGDDNMWSYQEVVMDSDMHKIYNMNDVQINEPGKIEFGDRVWLGARCTVLKDISIASDTVIGSSSMVYKSLEQPNAVYAGSPAKLIKSGIKWKRDMFGPIHP